MADETPPRASRSDLLSGTLDMMILRTLTISPLHGYAIAKHIERLSENVLRVEQGSLYPALERLLRKGWVTARWSRSPTGRRARYYTITASGRAQLNTIVAEYGRVSLAIARVIGEV
jgi:PadR family transcriptional regulator PadR